MKLKPKIHRTDILIIGGGTAGCFGALKIAKKSNTSVIIAEKANIKRSGCLAAGVNAFNAYINKGETPDSFVDYVKNEFDGIVREDLVYSIAKKLNQSAKTAENLGVPVLKDRKGDYVPRGRRGIKINGENIKPLLSKAVGSCSNIKVINRLNIIDYIMDGQKVKGACGFSLKENIFYIIYAKAVICTTGGAAGLYRPNNPEFSRHKIWYCPFNTGAGYAMGIRSGAEMTTFEMKFIALRCKDTISPTGTIANGLGTKQVNRKGINYMKKYPDSSTHMRLHATMRENMSGQGPCFLRTKGIDEDQQAELYKAYLNMSPAQTLKWMENGKGPSEENVEIEGTEPYIVGGHAASGYWVDKGRQTTLEGLFAAGDVAGGSPKKYVTGCFAEGWIAAESALDYIKGKRIPYPDETEIQRRLNEVNRLIGKQNDSYHKLYETEKEMQEVMDEYAGGISKNYLIEYDSIGHAKSRIHDLLKSCYHIKVNDLRELLFLYEIIDRLFVCKALLHHIESRRESRWHSYHHIRAYPHRDDKNWMKYVNSVYKNGSFKTIYRQLTGRNDIYEHSYRQRQVYRMRRMSERMSRKFDSSG